MPFVLTVDQRRSSGAPDRVDAVLAHLAHVPTVLAFERTAGDEFQGLMDDAVSVVGVILDLVRDGSWHIGLGVGPVEHPLQHSTRAARGPAFELARAAVDAAKRRPQHLAVRGVDEQRAGDAEAVLALMAAVAERRSDAAWEAIDLGTAGLGAAETAAKLGVSRQAVGQRLTAALWQQESAARPVAARLLTEADTPAPVTAVERVG